MPTPRMEGVTVLFNSQALIECLLCGAGLSHRKDKTQHSLRGETHGRGVSHDGKKRHKVLSRTGLSLNPVLLLTNYMTLGK